MCRLSEDDSIIDLVMSTCDADFVEIEQAYHNSVAVSPLADAVSPLADVTYTASGIRGMTAEERQAIPPMLLILGTMMEDMTHTSNQQT